MTHGWPAFFFLAAALIALRWNAIGGMILLVEGLAMIAVTRLLFHGPSADSTSLLLAGPPIISGAMLLIARRKSV